MLDSALILQKKATLPGVIREGDLLTSVSVSAAIDSSQLLSRDQLLAYRDNKILMAVVETLTYMSSVWAVRFSRPSLQTPSPETLKTDLLSTISVTSLTHSTTTATATTASSHGFFVNDIIVISGASPSGYNGTFTIVSVPTSSTFTYVMGSDPGTNATGTITAAFSVSTDGSVVHVKPSSAPSDAVVVDNQLYLRDILLYETLARVDAILKDPSDSGSSAPISRVDPDGTYISNSADLTAWSQAEGQDLRDSISHALPLSVDTIKKPDTSLTSRDNVLAYYVAKIADILRDPILVAAKLYIRVNAVSPAPATDAREAESYVLFSETPTTRTFRAEPFIPGRLLLTYDKTLKTLSWTNEEGDIHNPQPQPFLLGGITIDGPESGVSIDTVPVKPAKHDVDFWRQKASRVDFRTKKLTSLVSIQIPVQAFNVGSRAVFSGTAVTLMTPEHTLSFSTSASIVSGHTYRVYLGYRLTRQIKIDGSQSKLPGGPPNAVTASGKSVLFPTSGGSVVWPIPVITSGSWTLDIDYTNVLGDVPSGFTTSIQIGSITTVNQSLRFGIDGLKNGDVARKSINFRSDGRGYGDITITWSPTVTTNQLKVISIRLSWVPSIVNSDPGSRGTASVKLLNTLGQLVGDENSFTFSGRALRRDTAMFSFVAGSSSTLSSFEFDWSTWAGRDAALVSIERLEIYDLTSQTQIPNAAGLERFRSEMRDRILDQLVLSYQSYVADNPSVELRTTNRLGGLEWSKDSSSSWYKAMTRAEPRLLTTIRDSLEKDIGKPALVPNGLLFQYDPDTTHEVGSIQCGTLSQSFPVIVSFQPWMADVGIKVLSEDLWDDI